VAETSFSRVTSKLREALTAIEKMGLLWKSTRFARYLEAVQATSAASYPRTIDWTTHESREAFLLEALSQAVQLTSSRKLWNTVHLPDLVTRLERVLGGRDMPVVATDATDDARNVLLELAVGASLASPRRRVELTAGTEDLLLHLGSGTVLPVECKRPATRESVAKNVRKLRKQLGRHLPKYPSGGVAAVGLDRVFGGGGMPHVDRADEVAPTARRMLDESAIWIRDTEGARLPRVASVLMTAFFGAVFCFDPVLPIIVSRTAWMVLSDGTPERGILGDELAREFSD
jgi:hypothetical protein